MSLLSIVLSGKKFVVKQQGEVVCEDADFKQVFNYCVGYVEALYGGVKGLRHVSMSDAAKVRAFNQGNYKCLHLLNICMAA